MYKVFKKKVGIKQKFVKITFLTHTSYPELQKYPHPLSISILYLNQTHISCILRQDVMNPKVDYREDMLIVVNNKPHCK